MRRTIFNGEVLNPQSGYAGQSDGYVCAKEVRWDGVYTLKVIATDYLKNEATLAFCSDTQAVCKIKLHRNEVYTKGDLLDITYAGLSIQNGNIYLKRNAA